MISFTPQTPARYKLYLIWRNFARVSALRLALNGMFTRLSTSCDLPHFGATALALLAFNSCSCNVFQYLPCCFVSNRKIHDLSPPSPPLMLDLG